MARKNKANRGPRGQGDRNDRNDRGPRPRSRSPPRRFPSPRRDDNYRPADRYRRDDDYDGQRPQREHANWAPINGRSDSYRPPMPQRDDRDRVHDRYGDGGGGGGGEPNRPNFGGSDSYRPHGLPPHRPPPSGFRPPQSDFTFRSNNTAPNFPPAPTQPRSFQGGRGDRRGNARGRGRGRGGRVPFVHLSERKLLTKSVGNQPEEQLHDGAAGGNAKFRNLDELSDDEEEPMDLASSSSQSEPEQPSKKRTKTTSHAVKPDADAAPKWSNPDPYTALPCPDEQQQKKRDVVALIRKARNEAANQKAPDEAEDFIAFSSSEDEKDDDDEYEVVFVSSAPAASRSEQPARAQPLASNPPTGPAAATSGAIIAPSVLRDPTGPLGSRKRTADDVIKPPFHGHPKKAGMRPGDGLVTAAWSAKQDLDPCPWTDGVDHAGTNNAAVRLHKEILDFYNFVKPREFEQRIRESLVDNLKKAMSRDGRNFAEAKVFPFGSFMSGLYLPTADMDLVICSPSFMAGGIPKYSTAKSWLYKFTKLLQMQRLADPQHIEVISGARIPLVKYIDRATGLKVDVSFENMGGVHAIDKFEEWEEQYPAMPILVTIIKHFLLMRGINEPVNGGIGGFSVICLVVSMLQVNPSCQSKGLAPEHNLGEMLMEFFNLYGNSFDYETNAISTANRIGYIRKSDVNGLTYKSQNRLSIIDPNNGSNDISGGSSNTQVILRRFSEAFEILQSRMSELGKPGAAKPGSMLKPILAGDYSSFDQQRTYLRYVHEQNIGPCYD